MAFKLGRIRASLNKKLTKRSLDLCQKDLTAAKIELLKFNFIPPFNEPEKDTKQHFLVARDVWELSAELSIRMEDEAAFNRSIAQLNQFYFQFSYLLPESQNRLPILGAYLLSLLARNHIGDFNTELELFPFEDHSNDCIRFVIDLERHLMEGNYSAVLAAMDSIPLDYYSYFMNILINTVHEKIFDCSQSAYSSLTVSDAMKMFKLKNEKQLIDIAEERHWVIQNGSLIFNISAQSDSHISAKEIIMKSLSYARELERIV